MIGRRAFLKATGALGLALALPRPPVVPVVPAGGSLRVLPAAADILTDGTWHHLELFFDGRQARHYVDGAEVAPTPEFPIALQQAGAATWWQRGPFGSGMTISELGIWSEWPRLRKNPDRMFGPASDSPAVTYLPEYDGLTFYRLGATT